MSRILAYTSPARGHLYPIVPILGELQKRGHEISLRTLDSQVGLMRDLGIDAKPVSERIEQIELDDYKGRSLPGKGRRALSTFAMRAKHEVGDLRAAIETERPDALLIDCMTWGALAVAVAGGTGMPWAQFVPYPIPLPSPEVPPFGLGLRPAHGRLGRMRDRALGPASSMLNGVALKCINAMRAHDDLPALARGSNVFTLAPLVLYLTAEPFEYPRGDWPSCIHMVGPCAWDPPAEPPAWLDCLERPLVLISTSSERQNDKRLVKAAFEALAAEDLELVATLPAEDVADIDVPPNAHVERFLPHGALLAKASCAITHGGAGVTQKALAAGVPVCVVPFGRDQFEVASRVEVAGGGVCLRGRRLSAARLRVKVFEAMDRRPGARLLAEAFALAGGGIAGADLFGGLLGGLGGGEFGV